MSTPSRNSTLNIKPDKKDLKSLLEIPGVGPSIAMDLWLLGIQKREDLIGKDPEILYIQHNDQRRVITDICVLYTFRSAVYFAENFGKTQNPELLKWWNWMDRPKKTSLEKDAEIRREVLKKRRSN